MINPYASAQDQPYADTVDCMIMAAVEKLTIKGFSPAPTAEEVRATWRARADRPAGKALFYDEMGEWFVMVETPRDRLIFFYDPAYQSFTQL